METQPNTSILPPHARVIANPRVWMEGKAIDQLNHVARQPGCVAAVGMPDLHPGRGIPIGAAFAFRDVVLPSLIGGDAGCGARVVAVTRARHRGDALERRVRDRTDGPALPDADPASLLAAVWRSGPRGLATVEGVPDSLVALAAAEPEDDDPPSGPVPDDPGFGEDLGTAGGGNHFVEISTVETIADPAAARALGLTCGGLAVLAHSGSRGLGGALATRWHGALAPDAVPTYLADLRGACRYARANRLVLAWRLLEAVGAARPGRIAGTFDAVHNAVELAWLDGAPVWLHRKGCAPADRDQPTVVLGSRGTPSWVMLGAGRPDALWSVAHGAGRRMGRAEAVAKLRGRYHRRELSRRVLCDDTELLYAEHPDAYKAVEPVVESLVEAGAASRVASLIPILTVKR